MNHTVLKRIVMNSINYINESKELLTSKKLRIAESEDDNTKFVREQPYIILEEDVILMNDVILTYNYLEAFIL